LAISPPDQRTGARLDRELDPAAHDLAIRGHLAIVAGMATFGSWYFGKRRTSHQAVIDELSGWVWLRYSPPPR
jgi:hypothetical protein